VLAWVIKKLGEWKLFSDFGLTSVVYCGLCGYLSAYDAFKAGGVIEDSSKEQVFRPGFSFKPIFPQTSSRLGDMDQATAFGTTIVIIGFSVWRGSAR
jgi:hypothetical protein